jgi:nitrogenase molybdenum-iron protein beta chain
VSDILENPHGNCSLGGANATLSAIKGALQLYHSGPGCALQTCAGEAGQSGGRSPSTATSISIPCTNMIERDVILGGLNKLDTHVAGALEIYEAQTLFILTGCTAGITGEDVESVAKKYRDNGQNVYAVNCAGFLGESYRGYEIAFKALLDNIVDPAPPKKDPDLVNLFGIMPFHDLFWEGNFEEITRLLNKLGLRVNTFFSHRQGLEHVRSSSSASLNIVLSPWLLKSASHEYETRFGIPTLRIPYLPIGALDTAEFLRSVAKATGRTQRAEDVIEEEEEYFYHYLASGGPQAWRKFAVVGEAANVVGLTRFLANECSLTPLISIITDAVFRPLDKQLIVDTVSKLDYAKAPEVVFTGDQWEINRNIERFPDLTLMVGSTNEREIAIKMRLHFVAASYPNSERMVYNRTIAGYRGALTFLEDLYTNL